MQFEAIEARSILLRQTQEPIEVRYRGRTIAVWGTDRAAKECQYRTDLWGVGNARRIRYLAVVLPGFTAEANTTTTGHRAELKAHHDRHCEAYRGPVTAGLKNVCGNGNGRPSAGL